MTSELKKFGMSEIEKPSSLYSTRQESRFHLLLFPTYVIDSQFPISKFQGKISRTCFNASVFLKK